MYLLGFVTLAVAWATVRGPFHQRQRAVRAPGSPGALRVILSMWPIYLVLLILSIGTFMPSAGGPFLIKANGIASPQQQGHILAAGSIPAIFSSFAYGFLRRWFSDRVLLVATAGLMGAGMILAVPLHAELPLLAAFLVVGLGTGMKAPAVSSVLMAEAPETVRAVAAGLSFSGIFLGQFVAPNLLEITDRLVGIRGGFLAFGGVLVVVALTVALLGIGRQQVTEAVA
jgi:MFS family permease